MIYWIAFAAVVLLDTLCVKFLFPLLFNLDYSKVSFGLAFLVTTTSAVAVGIVLLEFGGRFLAVPFFEKLGFSEALSVQIVKNLYYTFAPLLCGLALVVWTRFIPSLGFYELWPNAFIAGVVLDFIDHGVVVPWSFRVAEALSGE